MIVFNNKKNILKIGGGGVVEREENKESWSKDGREKGKGRGEGGGGSISITTASEEAVDDMDRIDDGQPKSSNHYLLLPLRSFE